MTFVEQVKELSSDKRNKEYRTYVFDYFRSIKHNVMSLKGHIIIGYKTSSPVFDKRMGWPEYESADCLLDEKKEDEGRLFVVEPIDDYNSFLDEDGGFDREKATIIIK